MADASHSGIDVKCVVVGDGAVGKTCLLMTWRDRQFPTDYIPMVIDNEINKMHYNEYTINLDTWDIGGGEEFHRIRPLSYRDSDIFLVCFSMNTPDSFENIETKWIPEIKHHRSGFPFIIVGCREDITENQKCSNRDETNKLIYGYIRDCDNNYVLRDIVAMIGRYFQQSYDKFVTDKEARELCKKVGGYKYMNCSALKFRGIDEIFEEVCKCVTERYASILKSADASHSCQCDLL